MADSLETERLLLRRWCGADREPFARMCADPQVMAFMPGLLGRDEADVFADRNDAHFERHGFGLWALQVKRGPAFIGYVGLAVPRFEAHFTPCVEIGWRLDAAHWGKGYATEAARAAMAFARSAPAVRNLVSFTVPANTRSIRVMERIGLRHDPAGDFDHPKLPEGHTLRRHVLYRAPQGHEGEVTS